MSDNLDNNKNLNIDPDIIQRRASNPEKSVWVSASAGSGKTKVLTDRVLSLLLQDNQRPEAILCLTFTRTSAAEMANRLNNRLGKWATIGDEELIADLTNLLQYQPDKAVIARARRLFAMVLDAPGGLKIQNIHSFCQSLLGRFPVEANLAPHFKVIEDRDAVEMMLRARNSILSVKTGKLAGAIKDVTSLANEEQFAQLMQNLSSQRSKMQHFKNVMGVKGTDGMIKAIYDRLGIKINQSVNDIINDACDDSAFDSAKLRHSLVVLLQSKTKTDLTTAANMQPWLAADKKTRVEIFGQYKQAFLKKDDKAKAKTKVITKSHGEKNLDVVEILNCEQDRLLAVINKICAITVAKSTAALVILGEAMLKAYEMEKRNRALLDYNDLILKARDLMTGDAQAAQWVLYKLDGGIDHILIDEAQDTNPEQWQVITALADEFFAGDGAEYVNEYATENTNNKKISRSIFAVGDVKQSIYSFQGAEPKNFNNMRDHFKSAVINAGLNWDEVPMDVSFRSTNMILKAVDMTFKSDANKDGLVEKNGKVSHVAYRQGHAGHVELWPVIRLKKNTDDDQWQLPINHEITPAPEQRLAKIIAAKIESWIDNEYLPARGRKIRAGDILILVRRRKKIPDMIVRELKLRSIPVAGVDRIMLNQQISVQDLIQLGHFLCLPEDDLALAVILKSPFLGLDDDDLYQLAYGREISLWQRLGQMKNQDPRYLQAYQWLQRRMSRVAVIRPYEFFAECLSEICPVKDIQGNILSGRQAMIARLGIEADDPIDEFLNLAISFDQSHIASMQAFLHWFDSGEAEIKRDMEASLKDEVRIMTIHGAKGLQAPIVILPDTTDLPKDGGNKGDIRWVDNDGGFDLPIWTANKKYREKIGNKAREDSKSRLIQEYNRLLYVAMTRAEDRLYICGYHNANKINDCCWYNMIKTSMKNEKNVKIIKMDFSKFEGIDSGGLAGQGLIMTDNQSAEPKIDDNINEVKDDALATPKWMFKKATIEISPTKPLMASKPIDDDPPAHSPLSMAGNDLFKRGIITHKLLQNLPDMDVGSRMTAAKRYLALKTHGFAKKLQDDILTETMAVLNHPDFGVLFGVGSLAEVPIIGLVSGESNITKNIVISGQIDRLLVSDDEIFIIDYKTLRPSPRQEDKIPKAYLRQLAGYSQILAEIYPKHEIRTALLWTEDARLMEISHDLLDQYMAKA